MRRIRTIPGAAAEMKDKDPNTIVTEWVLRRWIKQGLIPTVPVPTRVVYIDMDKLEAFLDGQAVSD